MIHRQDRTEVRAEQTEVGLHRERNGRETRSEQKRKYQPVQTISMYKRREEEISCLYSP